MPTGFQKTRCPSSHLSSILLDLLRNIPELRVHLEFYPAPYHLGTTPDALSSQPLQFIPATAAVTHSHRVWLVF